MNNRIKELRTKHLKEKFGKKYTQKEFADALELSENFIWQIEKGDRIPSDRTISDICRNFDVSPEWIRTGKEPVFKPDRDNDSEVIDKFMEDVDNPMRSTIVAIIKTYMSMDKNGKDALMAFVKSLGDNLK